MANNDYKPLNPSARVIEGRFAGVCFFLNKVFSHSIPNFTTYIIEEDRVNPKLKCTFAGNREVYCMSTNMYKNSWSLMRPVGMYNHDDIVVLLGMSSNEERNPNQRDATPCRAFIFRVGDVNTVVINTKVGEREATFFSMDKKDEWEQFSCDARDVNMALRSITENSVDPDLTNGPFKSYLTTLITGQPAPDLTTSSIASPSVSEDKVDDEWDDIPF